MIRRRAIWAVEVMASASSRMMSLNERMEVLSAVGAVVNICLVPNLHSAPQADWQVDD